MRKYFRTPEKVKVFYILPTYLHEYCLRILCILFLFWFSCFFIESFLRLWLLAYVSYLCTLLLSLGWLFFQPDTNLFVYGHVEGWRREVWAVMLACQSVYTAVLKPPTLNAWKCLVFFIRGDFVHEVLMMRLHISFCRLLSCESYMPDANCCRGRFCGFFHFASFFFDIPRIRLKLESGYYKGMAKCVFAMDIWICN